MIFNPVAAGGRVFVAPRLRGLAFEPAKATSALSLIFAEDLIKSTPPTAWLWDGYLAPGAVTVISGDSKDGKSTLVYALLGALETGRPFAGSLTKKTKAIILSEEPDGPIVEKLEEFGENHRFHRFLKREQTYAIEWDSLIDWVADQAVATESGLIVVDTFGAMARFRDEEENSAGAVLGRIAPLKRAAAGLGLSILLVVHARKSGGKVAMGIRGSSALSGEANIILDLSRVGEGNRRKLEGVGHYKDIDPKRFLELKGSEYVVVGKDAEYLVGEHNESASERGKSINEMLVRGAFDVLGNASDQQILAEVNKAETVMSLSTVTRVREKLILSGFVAPSGGVGNKTDSRTFARTPR